MDEEKEERRGFRVTDRRRFVEGSEGTDAPDAPPASPSDAPPTHAGGASPDEPVTFATFVLGLSTQALLHLGEIEDPISGRVERDLVAAKQVIDILGILREKTRNNLDASEERLLDSMLYDLRLRYVDLARGEVKEGK